MAGRLVVVVLVGLAPGCLVEPDGSLYHQDSGLTGDLARLDAVRPGDLARDRPDLLPPDHGSPTEQGATPDQATPVDGAPDQSPLSVQLLAVRSGSGSIADTASSTSLTISPPLTDVDKTLLVFQATSDDADPALANVRCFLSGVSKIECDRVGVTGTVLIQWYTAEFQSGVKVQHFQPTCDASGTTTVSIAPVDPSKTFLLYSGRRDGTDQGEDDMETVELTSATTVEIGKAVGGCDLDARALQVVELDGASVTRGVTGAMSGTSLDVTGLSAADTTRTMLLYSYRGTLNGAAMCDRMVRGAVVSASTVSFSRGDGASGCAGATVDAISWERVELPPGVTVQQLKASVAGGSSSVTLALAQVDLGRTLAFSGGQWTGGQGIGEGSLSSNDVLGAMVARHELVDATTLRSTRDHTGGKASWSVFVVEF